MSKAHGESTIEFKLRLEVPFQVDHNENDALAAEEMLAWEDKAEKKLRTLLDGEWKGCYDLDKRDSWVNKWREGLEEGE